MIGLFVLLVVKSLDIERNSCGMGDWAFFKSGVNFDLLLDQFVAEDFKAHDWFWVVEVHLHFGYVSDIDLR